MSKRSPDDFSRRDFVVAMAAAGGGLLIGCRVNERRRIPGPTEEAAAADPAAFAPNAFVRVGTRRPGHRDHRPG